MREFSGVVELAELGVNLLALAGVVTLESGHRILTARIVGRHDDDVFEALVLNVFADCFVEIVVLPGHVEEEGIALFARILRGAGVGRDVEGLVLENSRSDGEHDVGEDDAAHEVDLVLLQQLVGGLLGDVGILLVVDDQHFGGQAAELAVQFLDRQIEAVADIDAEAGTGPGERGHKADLDLIGGMDGSGQHQRGGEGSQTDRHRVLLGRSRKCRIVAQEQADTAMTDVQTQV